jgi:hypothetical protein
LRGVGAPAVPAVTQATPGDTWQHIRHR